MEMYLLAHDLGTSGNKATLFDPSGKLIKSVTREYATSYSHGNWAEQNPEDWWEAVCGSTRELLAGRDPSTIACVAFSGQMMGCLPVDKKGKALRTHLLYCDQRATEETEFLTSRISTGEIYRITGHRPSASYAIEKLMWIKTHQPEIYRNTFKMLNAKDYLNFRLTGNMVTDYNDASGTNAFSLETLDWSDEILAAAAIEKDKLPRAVPSTAIIGEITSEAARATGLKAGTPVAAGAGDGGCATVGAGSVKPGATYNYLGSSSWISTTTEKPIYDPQMRTFTWAHPVPGFMQPCGTMQTAGGSYAWLKNQLAGRETDAAVREGGSAYEKINELISSSPPGARGISFLPYMLGERTPWWNPQAKGAFVGLNLEHTRADVFRSVLEGVTLNLAFTLQVFQKEIPIKEMLVIGGGARGAVWRQIMADVYGMEIHTPRYLEEATSMGAAIIGGVACGAFSSFDVVDRFVEIDTVTKPNFENRDLYLRMGELLEKTYRALEPLFPEYGS